MKHINSLEYVWKKIRSQHPSQHLHGEGSSIRGQYWSLLNIEHQTITFLMKLQPCEKLQNQAVPQHCLSLIIHQLIKLQFMIQFVFTNLPISTIPTAIHYNGYLHILNIYRLSDIFFYRSRVHFFTEIKLHQQDAVDRFFIGSSCYWVKLVHKGARKL